MPTIKAPELTRDLADTIASTAKKQLKVSRDYKLTRMTEIQESENLYMGVVEKLIKNPFNDCFPFMSGFVDYLLSKQDDAPVITFKHRAEEDYRKAIKTTAMWKADSSSVMPNAKWALKDRWAKKMATFSGVGIYKYFAESDPQYRSNFATVDHYDFHCEPSGGGNLENHLFCGQEGIFKTREELEAGAENGYYDKEQVGKLLASAGNQEHKEVTDQYNQRLNRHRAMKLDAETNNYTGQDIFKFVEWYLTHRGVRWYCLFEERTGIWIRVKLLREIFSVVEGMDDALWPYTCWHTHEDPLVFWSKAPADDARPIAKNINRLINQELYNRERRNTGKLAYDPTMFKDVESLEDWRPDAKTPVDTKNGTRQIGEGIFEFKVGELGGTINLVQFLDSYSGQKTASTPGAQGQAEGDKKVGIFFGELKQIEDRLGLYNKSYRECWGEIGIRYRVGLHDHVKDARIPISIMGANGIEWEEFTADDSKTIKEFEIDIEGGSEGEMIEQQRNEMKAQALASVQTVNPFWKDRERLKIAGYDDDAIKEAFSMAKPGLKALLSEAAEAERMIVEGKKPELNRGANAAFMQHLIDFATNLTLPDKDKENRIAIAVMKYANAHAIIAAQNEARDALSIINEAKVKAGMQQAPMGQNGAMQAPTSGQGMPTEGEFIQNPRGSAVSAGQMASGQFQQ